MTNQQTGLLMLLMTARVHPLGALDKAITTSFGAAWFCLNQLQSSVILASYYQDSLTSPLSKKTL